MKRMVLGGLAALLMSTSAWSADYLRGSVPAFGEAPSYPWAGIYFGAQAGIAYADFSFGSGVQPLIDELVNGPFIPENIPYTNWPNTFDGGGRAGTYGGFVGYNSQWGEIVLGAELNYNRASLEATSSQTTTQTIDIAGTSYVFSSTATASATLHDYATLRFRAGYAYNWMMPYVMVGLAAGRADVTRSLSVTSPVAPPGAPAAPLPVSITKNDAISIGYMAGFGVDIGLVPGVFLRAEYEFIQFAGFDDIEATVNTGRVAIGVKF